MVEIGKVVTLPKIADPRGNLTVVESHKEIPFAISRVYWIYDVPGRGDRGGHAHKHCRQILVAVSGSFDVTLDNGKQKRTYHLNHPYHGLFIDKGLWRTLEDFSSDAVCLVLAEDFFTEDDYIRDYKEFLSYVNP